MMDDVRYAFRQLRRHPAVALLAIVTLAVGIGAAAAMFGLVQGVLLSPPPFAQPDRLVLVSPVRVDGQPYDRPATSGQWLSWRRARTLERTAMYRWTFNFLVRGDGSRSVGGMNVTRDWFDVVGVKPLMGRTFTANEAGRPGVAPTAIVLGYDLWQREFGGDRDIIGKPVTLSRMPAPLPVVGVMPPGLRFLPDAGAAAEPNYDIDAKVDFWLGVTPDESHPERGAGNLIARLARGATARDAQVELAAMSGAIAAADARLAGLTTTATPVQSVLNRDGERLLVPLFGAVGLLFLIACANVSGLLVARGLQRQQEYATRAAIGAGRARLFRLVLIEAITVALTAAVLGAGLAYGIVAVLRAIGGRAVPRADAVQVGWPVLLFGVLAALVAGIVAGVLPAVRASWGDRFTLLKGSRTSVGRVERRLLASVAAVQVMLTVSLLAGAALLLRTAQNLDRVHPGYDTEHILAMTVTHVGPRDQSRAFHEQALERVAAIPGVRHAAFAWGVPLTGNSWPAEIEVAGRAAASSAIVDRISLPLRAVTEDYFAVMSMRLVNGRLFLPTDNDGAPRAVIVNQAFVRQHLGDGVALGRQLRSPGDDKPFTIVGVIADTRTERLRERPEPELYVSFRQNGAFSKHLVVRAAGDPLALAPQVRTALRALQPTVAVEHVTTMDAIRRQSTAAQTFALRLLAAFAIVATLLAAVGLYGVLSLSAGARTKELAVRQAIGAKRHQVIALVLGEGARLVAIGVACGLVGALLVGRLLQALLFDVTATDPTSLGGAALAFAGVAALACLLPAWRAGRVDVSAALRQG
ncbi:MAG: ABC transporter permease [Vicinamibacteraceae bacterium]